MDEKSNYARYGGAKLRAIRDRDHRQIHRMYLELRASIVEGRGREQILQRSKDLITTTLLHFESEERALGEDSLASLLAHQELHAEMIESLEDISRDLEQKLIRGALELLKYFEGRLLYHLEVEDAELERELSN
jgi:hemerythrin-like metal-binding protein